MRIDRVLILVGSTLVGCGGSSTSAPDVAAYRALGSDLAAAVEAHRAAAASLGAGGCAAERDRYDAQARPMLDRMASMSVEMDACMSGMGQSGAADMQRTCSSMVAELDAHVAAACSGDVAAEAARHAGVMDAMIQHEMDAAASMAGMMNGGGMMSGGMCRR